MHYSWHYSFMGSRIEELKKLLEQKYNIKTQDSLNFDGNGLFSIAFDVEETHPQFAEIIKMISQDTWDDGDLPIESNGVKLHFPVYSEEEYLTAKWLAVRSSFSKVIPENADHLCIKSCIFGKDKHGYLRARHKSEVGEYIIKSPVKWRRNHFASSSTGEQRLFCDDSARNILEQSHISGIEFRPVIRKSTKQPMEDIYQLVNTYTIPDHGIVGLDYTTEYVCPQCGMHMLCWSDDRFRFGIRAGSIPEGQDFCCTLPLFIGREPDKTYGAISLTLISQKMYRVLKDNMLDRSLWFEPIDIIE